MNGRASRYAGLKSTAHGTMHINPTGMKMMRKTERPRLKPRSMPPSIQIRNALGIHAHEKSRASARSHWRANRRHAPSMIRNAAFNVHGFGILLVSFIHLSALYGVGSMNSGECAINYVTAIPPFPLPRIIPNKGARAHAV